MSEKKIYHLIGADGKSYDSDMPGTLGGHCKLKIYGRLDCPSALRYIAKGQYVQHRVFFKDEETAIAAGYRPCGVCMKETYKKWKTQKNQEIKLLCLDLVRSCERISRRLISVRRKKKVSLAGKRSCPAARRNSEN